MILNLESCQFHDADVLYDKVKVVADHFKSMLMAVQLNICRKDLKLHNHIKRYVLKIHQASAGKLPSTSVMILA